MVAHHRQGASHGPLGLGQARGVVVGPRQVRHARDLGSRIGIVGQPPGDLDALLPASDEPDPTSAHRPDLLDARDAPDGEALVSPTDLEAPLDEHHPEAPVAGRDVAQHRQVARLEDLQRQGLPGQQHRPEGKHRQDVHGFNVAHDQPKRTRALPVDQLRARPCGADPD